jgi:Ni/Fe-hydrogenase 1 B-type cytochrome subunit
MTTKFSDRAIHADHPLKEEVIYVYEAPLRIWHWVNAFTITVLIATGFLIGVPLPTVPGEASHNYLMGNIRFIHFAAGYIFIIAFAFRLHWAVVGNEHAMQIFLPPFHKRAFWGGVWHELKWYAFMTNEPRKYIGHNPFATLVNHVTNVWGTIFMVITGLALYGEGTGMGTWQYDWFSSWVIPLFHGSQSLHTWHRLGMWGTVCYIVLHIYAALRADIMSRRSIVSSMVSGWRMFKDDRPPNIEEELWRVPEDRSSEKEEEK